jgi:acetyl esterase/lipase
MRPPTETAFRRRGGLLASAAAAASALALVGALPPASQEDPRATATAADARPLPVLRDVPYLGPRGPRLDVHRPAASGPRPAVLVVHGGAWSGGDKDAIGHVARAVAAAGLVAINVDYTLAAAGWPGHPRQVAELAAATDWVRANAEPLGIDPARLGALGSSAGGHLLALLATTRGAGLDAVVTWSAPFDLTAPALRRRLRAKIAGYLGCAPCPRRAAAGSPLAQVRTGTPPLMIVNSRRELIPAVQARQMAARLRVAGSPATLLLVPGALHAPRYSPAVLGPSMRFLTRRLR